jgi:putative membrane protein
MEQFVIRGIARKKERTGILIFVSQAERYARIIADEGIAAPCRSRTGRAPSTRWSAICGRTISPTASSRPSRRCGDVLTAHFPAAGKSAELPDRHLLDLESGRPSPT